MVVIKRSEKSIFKQQSFIAGSIILIASVFVTKIIGMLYRVPLAHILGGSGMAYFSSAYSIFMPVYAVAVSGIPPAVAKLTAEQCALGNYRNARRLRAAAMTFFFFVGFAASALLVVCSKPICDLIISEPLARISVVAIAPCIAIGAIASVERGYAEGMSNMLPTAVSETIEAVVKLAAGLGFALLASKKADADFANFGKVFGISCSTYQEAHSTALPFISAASVVGITLSNLIGCCYLWLSRKLTGDGLTEDMLSQPQEHTHKRKLLKSLLALAAPLALASVITTLSGLIDLVTINRCLDKAFNADKSYMTMRFAHVIAELSDGEKLSSFIYGSYSGLALTVFGIVPSLTAMFGRSILPKVSAAYATENKDALAQAVSTVMSLALFIAMPCGLGVFVFSEDILKLLFSGRINEIAVSIDVLSVLGIAAVAVSLCAPAFIIFQAAGKQNEPVKITLVGCAVKLICNLLLVSRPQLNITGAGLSTAICYFVMLFMCLHKLKAVCGHRSIGFKRFADILIASTLSIECAYLVYSVAGTVVSRSFSLVLGALFSSNIYILTAQILSVLPKSFKKNGKGLKSY